MKCVKSQLVYSVAASAPAITGAFTTDDLGAEPSGAFYHVTSTSGDGGTGGGRYCGFNASRSSSVYGASGTIRPISKEALMMIRY